MAHQVECQFSRDVSYKYRGGSWIIQGQSKRIQNKDGQLGTRSGAESGERRAEGYCAIQISQIMIQAVLVMNTQGKPRLAKFYDFRPPEKQQELIRSVFGVLSSRAENVSDFIEADSIFGPDTRLVYKHFATLYFVFVFDSSENELAMLDLIQVFVETLDKCFKNVCELDVVFNFNKMHTVLDEIIFGGQMLETSSTEVMKAVEEITKLEKASNTISLVPKSVSSWQAR
ncbi:hypothetical protein NE237_023350 [Protea cynaroides]|uniref:AP complex mu/sigma subunit domain-containing protein n=1 Tax=Protea cynaroides TaxID=273540 RepID=A0A9Q0HBA9_9MAGN|nr:hypothetical protein NE237_023350 [Protea cynaroides]